MHFREPVELLLADYAPFSDGLCDKRPDGRRGKLDVLRPLQMQKARLVLANGACVNERGQNHAEPAFCHRQRRARTQVRIRSHLQPQSRNSRFNELLAPELSGLFQLAQQKLL